MQPQATTVNTATAKEQATDIATLRPEEISDVMQLQSMNIVMASRIKDVAKAVPLTMRRLDKLPLQEPVMGSDPALQHMVGQLFETLGSLRHWPQDGNRRDAYMLQDELRFGGAEQHSAAYQEALGYYQQQASAYKDMKTLKLAIKGPLEGLLHDAKLGIEDSIRNNTPLDDILMQRINYMAYVLDEVRSYGMKLSRNALVGSAMISDAYREMDLPESFQPYQQQLAQLHENAARDLLVELGNRDYAKHMVQGDWEPHAHNDPHGPATVQLAQHCAESINTWRANNNRPAMTNDGFTVSAVMEGTEHYLEDEIRKHHQELSQPNQVHLRSFEEKPRNIHIAISELMQLHAQQQENTRSTTPQQQPSTSDRSLATQASIAAAPALDAPAQERQQQLNESALVDATAQAQQSNTTLPTV